MLSKCDCGNLKVKVAGFMFCTHCDGGHEGTCAKCRAYDTAVSRRISA
jgi:hypothetical protein